MLNGSVRYQLEPAERATWVDFLIFAALGPTPGIISDNDLRPYPHSFIANRFNIPLELFETTLEKCQAEGRITEDEHGIHITHWTEYQSEYERQKPYRQPQLAREPTVPAAAAGLPQKERAEKVQAPTEAAEQPGLAFQSSQDTTGVRVGPPPEPGDDRSPLLAAIAIAFEKHHMGLVTPVMLDDVRTLETEYPHLDPSWGGLAVAEAARQGKRTWAYIRAILTRCAAEGREPGVLQEQGAGNGEGRQPVGRVGRRTPTGRPTGFDPRRPESMYE